MLGKKKKNFALCVCTLFFFPSVGRSSLFAKKKKKKKEEEEDIQTIAHKRDDDGSEERRDYEYRCCERDCHENPQRERE